MIIYDWILIAALLLCLFAWWRHTMPGRGTQLALGATIALFVGLWAVSDDRWQAAAGAFLAALYLLSIIWHRWRGTRPKARTPWISGILFTLLTVAAAGLIWIFPAYDLPPPSGEYPVGVRDFELSDPARTGVMVAGPEEARRLLVRVWYPAGDVSGLEPRPYFTDAEANSTAQALGRFFNFPPFFTFTKHSDTNSFEGASLLPGGSELPVLIYSHGYTAFAGQNTALMEDLASHGYLVYSIQHTYDSSPTVFPNGDVVDSDPKLIEDMLGSLEPSESMKKAFAGASFGERREGHRQNYLESIESDNRLAARSAPTWVADRIFVLDRLQAGEVPDEVADVVAAGAYDRTGQMGMSFGGSTTGGVCMVDRRCAAGINLDGGDYHGTPFNANMPAPFMMFYSDFSSIIAQFAAMGLEVPDDYEPRGFNDFSYERHETAGLRSDVVRLKVNGATHLGVSDFSWFMRRPFRDAFFGTVDADAMLQIQNDFVRGFFDTHIRGLEVDFPDAQFAQHPDWVEPDDMNPVREWWLSENPQDETVRVVLETSEGDIEVVVYPGRAPISAGNFLNLVDGGHYDGATFYRAVENPDGSSIGIIQGGLIGEVMGLPPEQTEAMVGELTPLPPIAHERTDETGIPNERGTLALARLAPGTAGAEFFINITDNLVLDSGEPTERLDGHGYATFGRVLKGMRVVEAIQGLPRDGASSIEMLRGQILTNPVVIRRAYRVEPVEPVINPTLGPDYPADKLWTGHQRSSHFVTMRDGVKIAVDVILPRGYIGDGEPDGRFPVIFEYTPYHRSSINTDSGEVPVNFLRAFFIEKGYAYVSADFRGTGGSYGWMNQMSPDVAADGGEVVDWIAEQPWSNGRVGMYGGSYVGWSQMATASSKPEALKAIVPNVVGWDRHLLKPGGVYSYAFAQIWSAFAFGLHRSGSKGLVWSEARGAAPPVTPVVDEDGDGSLADEIPLDLDGSGFFHDDYAWPVDPAAPPQYGDESVRTEHHYFNAISEHTRHPDGAPGTFDLTALMNQTPFWDSPRMGDGLLMNDGNFGLLPSIADSGVAIYNYAGWWDPFARSGLQIFATLRDSNPSRVAVWPAYHQGLAEQAATTLGVGEQDRVYTQKYLTEMLRWYDRWLKEIDNGIDREPPVQVYVFNEGWRAENEWPLANETRQKYYLGSDGMLGDSAPETAGAVEYLADFTHDSGWGPPLPTAPISEINALRPKPAATADQFSRNRHQMMGVPETAPFRTAQAGQTVTFTSEPLEDDTTVIGHPVVHVWASSTEDYGDFFFYLEDVAPDGTAILITEHPHRAGFNRLVDDDLLIPNNPGIDVKPDLPWHGYREQDYSDRVFADGAVVEVVSDLLPIAWKFPAGHRIRLSVAAADWPTFRLHPKLAPTNRPDDPDNRVPTISLHHGGERASFVDLPVIED